MGHRTWLISLATWAIGLAAAAPYTRAEENSATPAAAPASSTPASSAPTAASDSAKSEPAKKDEAKTDVAQVATTSGGGTSGATSSEAKPATVISLGLSGDLSEAVAPAGLFGEIQKSLRQTLEKLQRAAEDDNVSAVVLKIRQPALGRGRLHELRQAVQQVRHKGKKVFADLQFAAPADYLLACACDQIVMPESGTLLLPGVRAEVTFYKQLFDKLGIQADMMQVGDYKGAAEPYTRTEMSEAFRRQYELVVDDLYDQMLDTIATDRRMPRDQVVKWVDRGLLTAQAAKEAGLIDLIGYETDYRQKIGQAIGAQQIRLVQNYGRKKVDTDFTGMMGMVKFLELLTGTEAKNRASGESKIAVVYAVGVIMAGSSAADLWGGQTLGADTIVAALRAAEKDSEVKAIVLRIDSPGGSALASDLIWQQVTECQKPIVASMGDIAASGGYYIAMGCDRIVAEPGTLTGSIGVVGGKLATRGLMEKLGIKTDVISRGKNSGIFSSDGPFLDSEREPFRAMMELTYQQFTSKAAAGRKMDPDRLKSLAGGRIWTGRQAQPHGLVDEIGTLEDAIRVAKQLAGVNVDKETEIQILPKARSFFEQLLDEPGNEADAAMGRALLHAWGQIMPGAEALGRDLWHAQQLMQEPVLLWLPYRVEIQ